jgi:hypothetical protein
MGTYSAFYLRRQARDEETRAAILGLYPNARIESSAGFIGGVLTRDDLEPPEHELEELSRQLGTDVIWVTSQTTAESFIFHHWRAGSQLRALWYGCAAEGVWERVEGQVEPWEQDAFWDEDSLESLLEGAETENEKRKLQTLWKDGLLKTGETAPVVSSADALEAVMEHYGLFGDAEATTSPPPVPPVEKAARDIKKFNQRVYVPRHEYRQVDAGSFRHLDLNFYNRTRDAFVAQGCTWMGDVENVTLRGTAMDLRSFIRILVSQDRTTCIGLYHPKPKIWVRLLMWVLRVKLGRTIDCESELSNGGFIVTSNAAEAGRLNPPPGFDIQYFPVKTAPDAVFRTHCQRLRGFLRANPGIHATTMRSTEEALDMQHRMQAAKAAFRKGIGFVTKDELERLGAKAQTAAEIKEAMDRSDD